MDVLNVTPDSFSSGGQHATRDAALRHTGQLAAEGVNMIDIGGESNRPSAEPLSLQAGLGCVMPIVEALRERGKPLSIGTYKPEMMQVTPDTGADLINDIWGFRRPDAIEAVAEGNVGLCVMYMQCDPETMQEAPSYVDLMDEVEAFPCTQTEALMAADVAAERASLDLGFGLGRTPDHNLTMLNRLTESQRIGLPLFTGSPRKPTLSAVSGGKPPAERMTASVAATLLATEWGTLIVCVHDVQLILEAT